jgi:zinc/manganese transport system substrate-binding protein
VLKRTTDLFDRRQVAALVYNEQTSGPETEQVRKAAEANDIPALGVSETLPAGKTYLTWMGDNLAVISQALDGAS